jgi:DNA polymerase-3 subunit alpha (Gram-positive type)
MMSFRIAYYKVHYPAEFYAVYLTTKITDFNWEVISRGKQAVLDRMDAISMKGNNATAKENDEVTVLEIVYEMFARGYEFEEPSLEGSEAARFGVRDGRVVVPLCGLSGVGINVARAIKEEQEKRPFATIEEMQDRAGANKTAVQAMREYGLLEGMPESDQLSFFSM